jgi:hypothetical protein
MLNDTAVNCSVGVEEVAQTNRPAGSAEAHFANYLQQSDQPLLGRLHVLAGNPVSIECGPRVRSEIQSRAARSQFFNSSLFSDPAWDILLELFAAEQEGRRVSISAAGLTAEIPLTTSLRWINALEREDLVERVGDPTDARRTFLKLTAQGRRSMTLYFQRCS